jgi:hypothetical protein
VASPKTDEALGLNATFVDLDVVVDLDLDFDGDLDLDLVTTVDAAFGSSQSSMTTSTTGGAPMRSGFPPGRR